MKFATIRRNPSSNFAELAGVWGRQLLPCVIVLALLTTGGYFALRGALNPDGAGMPSVTLVMFVDPDDDIRQPVDVLKSVGVTFDVQLYYGRLHDMPAYHAALIPGKIAQYTVPGHAGSRDVLEMAALRSPQALLLYLQPNILLSREWVLRGLAEFVTPSDVGIVGAEVQLDGTTLSAVAVSEAEGSIIVTQAAPENLALPAATDVYIPAYPCLLIHRSSILAALTVMPRVLVDTDAHRSLSFGIPRGTMPGATKEDLYAIYRAQYRAHFEIASYVATGVSIADLRTDEQKSIIVEFTKNLLSMRSLLAALSESKGALEAAAVPRVKAAVDKLINRRFDGSVFSRVRLINDFSSDLYTLSTVVTVTGDEFAVLLTAAMARSVSKRPVIVRGGPKVQLASARDGRFSERSSTLWKRTERLSSNVLHQNRAWLSASLHDIAARQVLNRVGRPADFSSAVIPRQLFFVSMPSQLKNYYSAQAAEKHTALRRWMQNQREFTTHVLGPSACDALAAGYNRAARIYPRLTLRNAKEHICRLLFAYTEGGVYVAPGLSEDLPPASHWALAPKSELLQYRLFDGTLTPPSLLFAAAPGNDCVRRAINAAVEGYSKYLLDDPASHVGALRDILSGQQDSRYFEQCSRDGRGGFTQVMARVMTPSWVEREWLAEFEAVVVAPIPPRVFTMVNVLHMQRGREDEPKRTSWMTELGSDWSFEAVTRRDCSNAALDLGLHAVAKGVLLPQATSWLTRQEHELTCAAVMCVAKGGLTIDASIAHGTAELHPGPSSIVMAVTSDRVPLPSYFGCSKGNVDIMRALREFDFNAADLKTRSQASMAASIILNVLVKGPALTIEMISSKTRSWVAVPPTPDLPPSIPMRVITIRHGDLTEQQQQAIDAWLPFQDSSVELIVIDDASCKTLANSRSLRSAHLWKTLHTAADRDNYCAMLAVHHYGGMYLAPGAMPRVPVESIVKATGAAAVFFTRAGGEKDQAILPWIFAAAAGHPILEATLAASEKGLRVHDMGAVVAIRAPSVAVEVVALDEFLLVEGLPTHRRVTNANSADDDAIKRSWTARILYLPLTHHQRSRRIKNAIRAYDDRNVPQLILAKYDALAILTKMHRLLPGEKEKRLPLLYWDQLPSTLQGLFTVTAMVSQSKSNDGSARLYIDPRIEVTGQVREGITERGGSAAVLPLPDGGFSPFFVGFDRDCANDLYNTLDGNLYDALRILSVRETIELNARLATPEALDFLGLSAKGFERSVMSSPACRADLRRFDYGAYAKNFRVMATSQPTDRIPATRWVITTDRLPPMRAEEAEWSFRFDNSDMETRYQSVDSCLSNPRSTLLEGFIDVAHRVPMDVIMALCELDVLYTEGGVVTSAVSVSRLPMPLWLDFSLPVAYVDSDTTAGTRRLIASAPGQPCIRSAIAILRTLVNNTLMRNVEGEREPDAVRRAFNEHFVRLLAACRPPAMSKELVQELGLMQNDHHEHQLAGEFRIPRQVFVVWKTAELFSKAAQIHNRWVLEEPAVLRRVVTDAECRELAAKYPEMLEAYDSFPVNVMRADTCRVLAVYYYGGIYMDLDVAWTKPLDQWFNWNAEIVVGNETYGRVVHNCNWFFGARPRHPCMASVLENIKRRWAIHRPTLQLNPHFVHAVTGPASFTEGIAACGATVALSRPDVTRDKIFHRFGSQTWQDEQEYESWTAVRANKTKAPE